MIWYLERSIANVKKEGFPARSLMILWDSLLAFRRIYGRVCHEPLAAKGYRLIIVLAVALGRCDYKGNNDQRNKDKPGNRDRGPQQHGQQQEDNRPDNQIEAASSERLHLPSAPLFRIT